MELVIILQLVSVSVTVWGYSMLSIFTKFADWFVYNFLYMDVGTKSANAIHFFIEDVAKIFALLFLMIITVSFFRSKLDPDKVRKYIAGKPKWLAYIMAVLLGSITPFCSCSSIPLFIGFIEAGIPFGVTMSFLITSPMINEIAIIVFASVIGWKFTIIYILTGMIIGLIGGIFMEKAGLEKYIENKVLNSVVKANIKTFKKKNN